MSVFSCIIYLLSCTTFSSGTEIERFVDELEPSWLVAVIIVVVVLILSGKAKGITRSNDRKVCSPDKSSILGDNWSNNRNKGSSQECDIQSLFFGPRWSSRPQRWHNKEPPPPESQDTNRNVPVFM